MHKPCVSHLKVALRLLRYLKLCPGQGLSFRKSDSFDITCFADSDWGKCLNTRKSITGYCIFLGQDLISWKSKKQTVSRSSGEAEYRAMCSATCEVVWIVNLLSELGVNCKVPVRLYCDSSAAISIAANPVFHERTKHFELDLYFLREKISSGFIQTVKVDSGSQLADIFTKGLSAGLFFLDLCVVKWFRVCTLLYLVIFSLVLRDWCSVLVDDHHVVNTELALGLELSGLPFFWALRKPVGSTELNLPDGFLERTRDRGVVWTSWVPQLQILNHESVGGFLTHCGWGSIVEGLMSGHPLIMLPFLVDQGLNARILVDKQVGIEVPRNEEDGSFTKESVARSVSVVVDDEGKICKANALEVSQIFGDTKREKTYINHFIDYLEKKRSVVSINDET
ncbi:putative soyasaponin III rhamnosyltransferase [Helianthus annuus]|uniref:Soyasaponin III rhamnosyltransferase n=1 Tax=Helianthus annuus TaxID=4232 RepID=A0A9K3H7Y7_HELAN|nr:putative soyasaponin III rhamnosyltransferase [Helianthus annuus]